jgi:hypothetical protein
MAKAKSFDVEGMSFFKLSTTGFKNGSSYPYFCIPAYQREYTWEPPQVMQLLGDVYDYFWEACQENQPNEADRGNQVSEKFIGAFILVEREQEVRRPQTVYDVIDGQQRITTLSLSIAAGLKVLLEISRKIAQLAEEAEAADPESKFLDRASQANRKIANQIKDAIKILYDSSDEDKYAPKLFRESNDVSYGSHPKKCEICEVSDSEVEAFYGSPTSRFFFYFAKVRAIHLSSKKTRFQDYKNALSDVLNGERYLESADKKTCYKRNYELAYEFLSQLRQGMIYEGDAEELPFNKGLGDESQYDPKPLPKQMDYCVFQESNLSELAADFSTILSNKESEFDNCLKALCTSSLYVLSFLDFLAKSVNIAVISGNKDSALDLFETMNTAGQPLGSIETFIPDVYQMVAKLEKNNGVDKNAFLDKEESFGVLQNRSIKDVVSSLQNVFGISKNRSGVPTVVIWFSLIGFGKKVGKNFSIQRSELKKSFRSFIGVDQGNFTFDSETTWKKIHEFVSLLSIVGKWWVYCYGESPDLEESQNIPISKRFEGNWAFVNGFLPEELQDKVKQSEIDVFNVCVQFLMRAGQSLAIAILGRYYVQLYKNPTVHNLSELIKAAKAVAAFTAVWLSGEKGSTQYAETQRRAMVHAVDAKKVKQTPGKLAYFWESSNSAGECVTAEQMQKSFISGYEARNGSFSLQTWTEKLPESELAALRKEVNRFLLLLYWHCSTGADCYESIGIRKQADKFEINFLTGEKWNVLTTLEIEHIVPREPKNPKDWNLDFVPNSSQGRRIINQIGNTTLLPKKVNVFASNKSWEYKRSLYETFCASNTDKAVEILKGLDQIPDRKTIESQVRKLYGEFESVDTFLVKSVRHVDHWDAATIQTRTNAIAMIVWPLLSNWLGRPEKFSVEEMEALVANQVKQLSKKGSDEQGSQPSVNEEVHENLRPFLVAIPRKNWTEITNTKLSIDNEQVYLCVRVEEGSTILEMGSRAGRDIRARFGEMPEQYVQLQLKKGKEDTRGCKQLLVFTGIGSEGNSYLLSLVKGRKKHFIAK